MTQRLRKIWVTTHLWLGLSLGLLFVLTGLSGSVLVFDHAIDEWLHPELLLAARGEATNPQPQTPLSPLSPDWSQLDAVIATAATAFPEQLADRSFIEPPRTPEGVWTIWCRSHHGEATGYTQVYVDPTTVEVTGCRTWGEYFVSWVYRLHDELLMGEVGKTIVGLTGFALIVSIATGIFLWWPLWKHSWRAAFALRSGRRFQYDLHKILGIVSGAVLLVIAFTGVYLVFPGWVKPAVKLLSSETIPAAANLTSARQPGQSPISAGDAAEIARRVLPGGVLKRLQFPPDPNATYVARMRLAGDVRHSSGNSRVWIDQYSGKVLAVRDWNRRTAADTFFAWQFPLHNGEAFGLVGRWVVFFTGLAPAVLYVTGFVLWWRKRKSRQRQRGSRLQDSIAVAAILLTCLLGIGLWRATAPQVESETVGEGYLEVTDLAGQTVVLRQPVERVVLMRSLGIYELAAVLGDEIDDRLVGWDSSLESGDQDTYRAFVERFPRLQKIPVLGDSLRDTVSAEAVLALKPDLVILNTYMRDRHHEGVARLEQAGVPLLYLDLSDPFEGPQDSILLLGKVLGKEERARAIVGWIDQHLNEVFNRLETIQSPAPSIYLEAGTQGAAAYGNTFGTDGHGNAVNWGSVLSQLRCRNVAAESVTGAYGMGRIRPEYLLAANPEVVVITGAHWTAYQDSLRLGYFADPVEARGRLREFLSRPGWCELEAVEHSRVHGIHTRFGSHVMSFAAASQIAKWLYPKEFQDLDPEADWREFHERFLPVKYGGTWMVSLQDE